MNSLKGIQKLPVLPCGLLLKRTLAAPAACTEPAVRSMWFCRTRSRCWFGGPCEASSHRSTSSSSRRPRRTPEKDRQRQKATPEKASPQLPAPPGSPVSAAAAPTRPQVPTRAYLLKDHPPSKHAACCIMRAVTTPWKDENALKRYARTLYGNFALPLGLQAASQLLKEAAGLGCLGCLFEGLCRLFRCRACWPRGAGFRAKAWGEAKGHLQGPLR